MSKYGIQIKGTSPILRNGQGFTPGHKPQLSTYDKGGRVGFKRGGGISETSKKQTKAGLKKSTPGLKKAAATVGALAAGPIGVATAGGVLAHKALKKKLKGSRTKKFGGGRTDLIEELGRVEAEPSNRNRRAEISRVHGELNKGYNKGGRVGLKKGGDDKWIQKVDASIKRRGTKGKCTPITKKGCTGRAKALAKTFKKMAAKRKS